jgi:endoribonuclease LACTB2
MRAVSLPAHNPGPMTGDGNRTWLVPGRRTVLVDAGTGQPRHVEALEAALENAGRDLDAVLITHAHPDHMSGARTLRERWPRASFHKHPCPGCDERYRVSCAPLQDGETIAAGDDELAVVHTPGHAPDHVCFWHEASRTVFSGDLLVEGSTVVIPASRGGRLADYLRSLERVLALEPTRALPAHGPEIRQPRELLTSYISHRRRRERQVLEALTRAPATPAVLAGMIYDRLPAELRAMAEESVLAHLIKLEEDGAVTRHDDLFMLTR